MTPATAFFLLALITDHGVAVVPVPGVGEAAKADCETMVVQAKQQHRVRHVFCLQGKGEAAS